MFYQLVLATLVLCEDNIDLDTAPWILAAQRCGIRSVIVPYTIANSVELTEAYVFSEPLQLKTSRQSPRCSPVSKMGHPAQGAEIPAHELRADCGDRSAGPRAAQSPAAQQRAAATSASCAMRDYYREAGIPAAQITVTGTLADDVISSAGQGDAASRAAPG